MSDDGVDRQIKWATLLADQLYEDDPECITTAADLLDAMATVELRLVTDPLGISSQAYLAHSMRRTHERST
jgi:hypothetical protein